MDFSECMNKPEPPVSVGMLCHDTEYLVDETVYKVLDVYEKNDKFYALCEYTDEFDGEKKQEEIFAYYLEEIKPES